MNRLVTRGLFTSIAATSLLVGLVAAPALAAKSTTDKVTTGTWGQGVAVVDPTVTPGSTPSSYAAIDLSMTLSNPTLSWDNGPNDVIGGCGSPGCLPDVMMLGVWKFPYVAGDGPGANAGGHFNLTGDDAKGHSVSIRLKIQSDTGFAHLPSWAQLADQVTTGTWGQGVAVVDPMVAPNAVTPSSYAAIDLSITLNHPTLSWDNGPDNVIGGCGAPGCLPDVMTPAVYKFPYVAGDGPGANAGGHFTLSGQDDSGNSVVIVLTIQIDMGFANLPSWATP